MSRRRLHLGAFMRSISIDALVHYDSAMRSLSIIPNPDGPLPPISESNASKSGRDRIVAYARETGATIRQLAAKAGSYAGLAFVGSPATIADAMEAWLGERGSDRFNIMFPYVPGGLDDITAKVVPELQPRGLFRTAYEGPTLRNHLGLPRPANRFFPGG